MQQTQNQIDPDMQVINLVNRAVKQKQTEAMIVRRRAERKREALRRMVWEAGIYGASSVLSFWAGARHLMVPAMGISMGIVCGVFCIIRVDRHFRRR